MHQIMRNPTKVIVTPKGTRISSLVFENVIRKRAIKNVQTDHISRPLGRLYRVANNSRKWRGFLVLRKYGI